MSGQDKDLREARRQREAFRRDTLDREYVTAFGEKIRELYPHCPKETATRVAEHACRKHSGRIGRTGMAKDFDPMAVELALKAYVRHELTDYDEHLGKGVDRSDARELVWQDVARILEEWSGESR